MTELRYVLRVLRRSPGFTAVAILSLALGIGANTAIHGASRALLSEPLAVADPERLMAITNQLTTPLGLSGVWQINGSSYRDPATGRNYRANISYPMFTALRETAAATADVFAFTFIREVNVSIDGQAVVGAGALATGNYFRGVGVGAILGRALTDDDDRPGASTAVVSHRFWVNTLGGDPSAVGKRIHVNGVPFTIVGVSAPGFFGMSKGGFFPPIDVTMPLHAQPALAPQWGPAGRSLFEMDRIFWLHSMARLKPGASAAALQAALATTFARTLAASADPSLQRATAVDVRLLPGGRGIESLSRRTEQPLQILTGVVALVLLIACANLANLMLARGVARQKEMSIRLALGSGRLRLVRQVLIESLVLSAAGGALGVLLGVWGGRALIAMLTASAGRTALTVPIDWRLLISTSAAAAAASVLFGLLPALRLTRCEVAPTLKHAGAGGGAPNLAAGRVLIAAQVAVSVPLLVGAFVFLQTLRNLARVELGFNPDRLVVFRIDPALNGYDPARVERTYAQVLDRVGSVPGVASATLVQEALLSGWSSNTNVTLGNGTKVDLYYNRVGPRYFATMGIPILAGRAIDDRDRSAAPHVAVLNEAAARALFGGGGVVGRRFSPFGSAVPPVYSRNEVEIVGIARDSKYDSVRKAVVPTMFLPYAQVSGVLLRSMHVAVRAAAPPGALMPALRAAVADVDRDVPVTELKTQAAQIDETLGTEIAFTRLLVAFGVFALFLACIGVHGVTAYAVARRMSEIGVRIALGAQRGDVLWLILRQVVVVTAAGLIVGVPAAVAATRLLAAFLYGVAPNDPASLAAAAAVMAIVAAAAGFLPARRAARLDPLVALRYE